MSGTWSVRSLAARAKKVRRLRYALAAAVVAIAVLTVAAALHAQGTPSKPILDGISDVYRQSSSIWRARLIPFAQRTFILLAGLEFAISGMLWSLRRESLDEIAAKFLLKFTLIAFLLTLITAFTAWVPPIINGFVVVGEQAVGGGTVTPSDVVEIGRETSMRVLQSLGVSVLVRDPAMVLYGGLSAIVISFAYMVIAAQLVLVLVQAYVVVLGGGVVLLGFSASRWTAAFAENLIGFAFYIGVKAFLLYLVVGVGTNIAQSWIPLIQGSSFFGPASAIGQVTAGAVIFAIISVQIPNSVAGRLTANHSFGLAQALRALS